MRPKALPSAEEIAARLIPVATTSEDREWVYIDPRTEREFSLRQSSGADGAQRFLLSECAPNGRMARFDAEGRLESAWDEPRILEAEARAGPNGFVDELRRRGIEPGSAVMVGDGYSINSLFYASKEACAEAIASRLADNVRHRATRELTAAERSRNALSQSKSSAAYWAAASKAVGESLAVEKGLFRGCHGMSGAPLDAEAKLSILSYLNKPGQHAWLEIRSLCAVGHATLWQAWRASDPSAPESGSEGFPRPDALRAAIASAVERRVRECEESLAAAKASKAVALAP